MGCVIQRFNVGDGRLVQYVMTAIRPEVRKSGKYRICAGSRCSREVPLNVRGRPRMYCSSACRLRAWEESREILGAYNWGRSWPRMSEYVCVHCGHVGYPYCSSGCSRAYERDTWLLLAAVLSYKRVSVKFEWSGIGGWNE